MERHIFLVGMPGSGSSVLVLLLFQFLQILYLYTVVYLS